MYPGAVKTIYSPGSYNDGNPHQVVATASSAGMFLYVDGSQVASDPTTTGADTFTGWGRAGQDDLSGWTNTPTSNYLHGTIDEVAVYPTALSPQRVQVHYCDGANLNCLSMSSPTHGHVFTAHPQRQRPDADRGRELRPHRQHRRQRLEPACDIDHVHHRNPPTPGDRDHRGVDAVVGMRQRFHVHWTFTLSSGP